MAQADGPEEKGAAVLNGAMILVLSLMLAAFALWAASNYLWRVMAGRADFAQIDLSDVIVRLLVPLCLVVSAVRGTMFGLRMMRSKSLRH